MLCVSFYEFISNASLRLFVKNNVSFADFV